MLRNTFLLIYIVLEFWHHFNWDTVYSSSAQL